MSEDTIIALTLHRIADEFDIDDLASTSFVASDGVMSVGISTNEQAQSRVQEWLHARAGKYQEDRGRSMSGSDYAHCAECTPRLRVEESWEGGSDAWPLPEMVVTHEGTFHADGFTPLVITDDDMRAGGWRKMRRFVTEWEEI